MNLNAKNYTEVAEPMSNIYGALYSTLATDENSQRKSMRYIGSCIGRVFYLLDKAGRVAGDKRAGRYNVYLVNGVEDPGAALENARRQSLAAANDLVRAYGMLDVKLNKSLIDNIMILGLRHAVEPLDPENQRALGAAVKARKSWAMAYCGMAAAERGPDAAGGRGAGADVHCPGGGQPAHRHGLRGVRQDHGPDSLRRGEPAQPALCAG